MMLWRKEEKRKMVDSYFSPNLYLLWDSALLLSTSVLVKLYLMFAILSLVLSIRFFKYHIFNGFVLSFFSLSILSFLIFPLMFIYFSSKSLENSPCNVLKLDINQCQSYIKYDFNRENLNFSLILIKQNKKNNLFILKDSTVSQDPLNSNGLKEYLRVEIFSKNLSEKEAKDFLLESKNLNLLILENKEAILNKYNEFKMGDL